MDNTENVAYTIKEINAVGGKTVYNAAITCPPSIVTTVQDTWNKAFESSELLFVCDKTKKKKG